MKLSQKTKKQAAEEHYNKLFKNPWKIAKKNMCRVCLQEGSVSIYETEENIPQALLTFGDIHVGKEDGLPTHLCRVCYEFLKTANLFRMTAKKSEERLQQPKLEFIDESEQLDNDYNYNSDDENEIKSNALKEKIGPPQKEKKTSKYAQKVTCHVCKKVINRSYIKEHLTMHDPDHEKYVCEICGKFFRLRCAYHNHRLRHRSDFPYKCQLCPYRGRYAELLKNHMRTHSGDYRYMCTECPARFLFKSNLNSHMLKHKEPQFKCDTCERAFHTKLMLQRHFEADHLGIKNHVCSVCGKAFGYRNAMMKHQRHVHKREKYIFGRMPSYLVAEQRQNEQGN
ncbi:zinc-finger associated domain (zf-AD) domain-containing protein [Phthorimaea operculella]|nr:zinc-finger associated domain (zf-AD) domain-containing protein [Phthorimaea operculella]